MIGTPCNDSLEQKLEKVQYSAALTITGAMKKASQERLYKELSSISLTDKRSYRKRVFFYKIVNGLVYRIYNLICSLIMRERIILVQVQL